MPAKELMELDCYVVPAQAFEGAFSLALTPFGYLIHIDHERGQMGYVWLKDHLLTIGSKRYRLGFNAEGDMTLYERIGGAASGAENWNATSQRLDHWHTV